ncbi:MAG: efflux RND transporter periplasmic adaptor subunit [Peptococcales bacterium]|jgi:HlyD family secretion protein
MKTKWKLIFISLTIFVILGLSLFNLNQGLEAELLEVKPQVIANTFSEEGKVIPEVEQPLYSVDSQEIIEIFVKEGQEVKKGDILALLDVENLSFQLKQLEGQLTSVQGEQDKTILEQYAGQIKNQELQIKQAELELATANTNLTRVDQLYIAGGVAKKELEEARNSAETAKVNLEQQKENLRILKESSSPWGGATLYYTGRLEAIQAQIEQIQKQIEKSTILAPFDGIVANLSLKKGEKTQPHTPIMTIFQKDSYLIEVFLLTRDVETIEKGMEVTLIQDQRGNDKIFSGKVKEISPTAVEKISALGLAEERVKVLINISSEEDINLFPGYRLDVEFATEQLANQLVVPQTALFPYEQGYGLWVVEKGKAKIQRVEKGMETNRYVAIQKGLKEGDLVILNPQLAGLKDGKKVR